MAQFFQIHPENPQGRLVNQAADILQRGGLMAFPTDSAYAIGCHLGDKNAIDRIRQIRQLDKHHNFTLMCRDLSELATYAKVSNSVFRMLKAHTPGPYTFVLEATNEVPRRVMHPKRKTIGLRVPENNIALELIAALGEPLMTSTLIMPGDEYPLTDPYDIRETLEHQLDLVVDGGYCGMEATTVIDLTGETPELIRQGCGSFEDFMA
ncbi:L-threonylcarbamoyladenylate synthase [Pseudoteredinibacter isoporae]|uniref:tRNA threonylcarbamoyl adenosine modification protein (Sua5/YciO/YrdC/YwlC family) n=1 Tax=Pseudoteredinibacter isoporae TaxID=570281 RepID=A0A7X0MZL7_9GAMM|nr:tRNA threonylcarbamoyl adenosine modification protein (Sua5/YciO/YrdC/YwlC family) [Pseudoteredinibacter isoporae]NHO88806.1 threonylcarbamoyl-AMP synthase [Pseudoteredinibacter isoporae]NIB24486.1 threonylcarbamoyl-AMP synthase [Pseudoteredinibacter isoporae]